MRLCCVICILVAVLFPHQGFGYQIHNPGVTEFPSQIDDFEPYERGNVGRFGDPANPNRRKVNEGNPFSPTQPNIFDGVHPRQVCPGMIGPLSDGQFYCTAKDNGYCDRRSGACFCFEGYEGQDCSECRASHYKVGAACLPKNLCPNECSGGGICNYNNGTCSCFPHRVGADCAQLLCSTFDSKCLECDSDRCWRCVDSFYVLGDNTCAPCTNFDPRCSHCTASEGCLTCTDPLLTSTRRSGRREQDTMLPFDEETRVLAHTLPFGTQSRYAFEEAEGFLLTSDQAALKAAGVDVGPLSSDHAGEWRGYGLDDAGSEGYGSSPLPELNTLSRECDQGLRTDDSWICRPFQESHRVCGHPGTISFRSPSYAIGEDETHVRIHVRRSGGGLGAVSVDYELRHLTTDVNDVTATAQYTTTQRLHFPVGVVQLSFLVRINDDAEVEENERFMLELSDPQGGANLGPQRQAIVVVVDDDAPRVSYLNTTLRGDALTQANVAGQTATFIINGDAHDGTSHNGDRWVVQLWDPTSQYLGKLGNRGNRGVHDFIDLDSGGLGAPHSAGGGQWRVNVLDGSAVPTGQRTGEYTASLQPIRRGDFELVVQHAKQGGLLGEYYDNPYLYGTPVISRVDHLVNFTWYDGCISAFATDFVSVRWTGKVLPATADTYVFTVLADDNVRLWVDYELLIDKWLFPANESSGNIALEADKLYDIRLEYRDHDGFANCVLYWSSSSTPKDVIPATALYSTRDIKGSPFPFRVTAAAPHADADGRAGRGTIAYGDGLIATEAGTPARFNIISRDQFDNDRLELAQLDEFEVSAVYRAGSGTGPGGVSEGIGDTTVRGAIAWNETSMEHQVAYAPTIAGTYDLFVRQMSQGTLQNILGSPFRIEVPPAPMQGRASDANGAGLVGGIVGQPFTVVVTARDHLSNLINFGGHDVELVAYHSSRPIAVVGTVSDSGTGTYTCVYVPKANGTYSVAVTVLGQHIADSPYTVLAEVAPIDGAQSFATGPGLTSAESAVLQYFVVHMRDAFENPVPIAGAALTAQLTNERTSAVVTGTVTHLGDDRYEVSYLPTDDGFWLLEVFVAGVELSNSPFHPKILPGVVAGATSSATGEGLMHAMAGEIAVFTVQARDAAGNNKVTGENTLDISLTTTLNGQVQNVAGVAEYIGDGVYNCTYNATVAQAHTLVVTIDSAPISGSPFSPVVVPNIIFPQYTVVEGSGLDGCVAGELAPLSFKAVDRFNNDVLREENFEFISARLAGVGPSGLGTVVPEQVLPLRPVAGLPGTVDFSVTPTISGQYVLTVDQAIPGGLLGTYFQQPDFHNVLLRRVDPAVEFDWGVYPPGVGVTVAERYSVRWDGFIRPNISELHTFKFASTGDVRFRVGPAFASIAQSGSGTGTVPAAVESKRPQRSGWATLVNAWPSLEQTHQASMELKAGLFYPVELELRTVGRSAAIQMTYSTSTTPAGPWPQNRLFPPWTTAVAQSPWSPLVVPAATSPTNCRAVGAGLSMATANRQSTFMVEVRDAFNNTRGIGGDQISVIGVRVSGDGHSDAQPVQYNGKVIDLKNGFYNVTYTPAVAGKYLLYIRVNPVLPSADIGLAELNRRTVQYEIENSPFSVRVGDDSAVATTTTAEGVGLHDAEAGIQAAFTIQVRDIDGNRKQSDSQVVAVTATMQPGQGQTLRGVTVYGVVRYMDVGLYNVTYTAELAGRYDLQVTVDGASISGAPFFLVVRPTVASGKASTTVGLAGTSMSAGVESRFTITARDRFGNALLTGGLAWWVRFYGPSTQHVSPVTSGVVRDLTDGTYEVTFVPPLAGAYQVDVRLLDSSPHAKHGLTGTYFTNQWFAEPPLISQVDPIINQTLNAESADSALPIYSAAYASVRWRGYFRAPLSGRYTFYVTSDDGVRLVVAGEAVVDAIDEPNVTGRGTLSFRFAEAQVYDLKLEYKQLTGPGFVRLEYSASDAPKHGGSIDRQVVPSSLLYPAEEDVVGSPYFISIA